MEINKPKIYQDINQLWEGLTNALQDLYNYIEPIFTFTTEDIYVSLSLIVIIFVYAVIMAGLDTLREKYNAKKPCQGTRSMQPLILAAALHTLRYIAGKIKLGLSVLHKKYIAKISNRV